MEILDKKYNRKDYLDFLSNKFDFSQLIQPVSTDDASVDSFEQLGFISTVDDKHDDKQLPVFEIHIKPNTQLQRNRVGLRNLVARQVQSEDGALAVYVDDKNSQWRFSFIAIEYSFSEHGLEKKQTASKRFTYLLGKGTKTRTAKDRFSTLNLQSTIEELETAFAVETLSKEFYKKLYAWYEKAQAQVIFPDDEQADNHQQTSLIRLLTRLLFVWFLKEKQLINADLFDETKLKKLIDYDKPSSFYKAILQNLFFATLNRQTMERCFRNTNEDGTANGTNYLATNIYRYQKYFSNANELAIIKLFEQTPFLNGGLFECLDREASEQEKQNYDNDKSIRPVKSAIRIDGFSDKASNLLKLDNSLFFNEDEDDENDLGLIDLFNQYQFTVEESTPLDVEVALDPELLGKVFENLLASYNPETGNQARKATGSFYTPREIVSYMVDESLKQHFKQHTDLTIDEINALFVEGDNTLKDKKIRVIIVAIDKLKILDPAVGSGAYPMGILQRLVNILEKIDPENVHFKQQQIAKAEQIPDETSKQSAITAIEQVFSAKNQHNTYGKKLFLIENAIYGVDIQPIAIQICKLRFFISLTVEQKPNKDKADNYGIKALPNLETKFIVANTLLPLGKIETAAGMTETIGLFDTGVQELQKQLAQVRHRYFSAKTLKTKRKAKEADKSLREQMLATLEQSGITPEVKASMQKVVHWDLYNQNSIADWFDPEWQFGVKDGFDIVIGNPPYFNIQTLGAKSPIARKIQNNYPDIWQDKSDILFYFIARGINITNSIVIFITSNAFLHSAKAQKLRNFILDNAPIEKIINFEQYMIFSSASITSTVMMFNKNRKSNKCMAYNFKEKEYSEYELMKAALDDSNYFNVSLKKDDVFALVNKNISDVNDKIDGLYPKLKTVFKIGKGMETAANKQFLFKEYPNQFPQKFIRKRMSGEIINKYEIAPVKEYLLYFEDIDNFEDLPSSVQNHLLENRVLLEKRATVKNEGRVWWRYSRPMHKNYYNLDKIWCSYRAKENIFCFDDTKEYIGLTNTTVIFDTNSDLNLKYLLALLNSKILNFRYKSIGKQTGNGVYEYFENGIGKLPIPQISKTKQQPFINLVNKIIKAKKQAKDTTALETKIDQMVYKLYQLTADEIKIIENST